jgi:hypothetical protein
MSEFLALGRYASLVEHMQTRRGNLYFIQYLFNIPELK